VSNDEVRRRALGFDGPRLSQIILLHRLRWLEQVLLIPVERLRYCALFALAASGRKRHRGEQSMICN
jgi:hypothetical protein